MAHFDIHLTFISSGSSEHLMPRSVMESHGTRASFAIPVAPRDERPEQLLPALSPIPNSANPVR